MFQLDHYFATQRIGLQAVMRVKAATLGQILFLLLSSELQEASVSLDNFQALEKDLYKVMKDNQSFWPGETPCYFVGRFWWN